MRTKWLAGVLAVGALNSASILSAAVVPLGGPVQIVTYDFSLPTPGSGTAPNDFHNIPFYIFDGANSGLTGNPNVILSPSVADQSGHGRTLLHDQLTPSSSNAHTRYVTSSQTGTSGLFSEFQGVPRTANTSAVSGAGVFSRSEFAGGFIALTKMEVDQTVAPASYLPLFSIGDYIALAISPSGTLAATIQGSFGPSTRIEGTTSILRPSASDPRPYRDVKVWYDVNNTPSTADDTLSIYLDGTLEASANFALTGVNFSGPLAFFGFATVAGGATQGVKLDYFSISIPEPASLGAIVCLAVLTVHRRRDRAAC